MKTWRSTKICHWRCLLQSLAATAANLCWDYSVNLFFKICSLRQKFCTFLRLGANLLGFSIDLSQTLFVLKFVRSKPKKDTKQYKKRASGVKIPLQIPEWANLLKKYSSILRMKCYLYSIKSGKICNLAAVLAAGQGSTWQGCGKRNEGGEGANKFKFSTIGSRPN